MSSIWQRLPTNISQMLSEVTGRVQGYTRRAACFAPPNLAPFFLASLSPQHRPRTPSPSHHMTFTTPPGSQLWRFREEGKQWDT